MPTITRRRPLGLHVAATAACVLALTACNGAAAQDEESTPTATTAPPSSVPATTAPSSSPPASSPATSSAASSSPASSSSVAAQPSSSAADLTGPKEVAVTVMELFARPDEPERRWFSELRPYLEEEYAVDAEYIDPARIPFDKIISGPVMDGDSHNAQVALATFKTNAGPWYVELHQNVPGGDWLVGGIGSADE